MTSNECKGFSREHARLSGQAGYTLAELILATAIALVVLGAVFTLVNPARGIFRTQPQVSDMQQRMRVAVDLLQKDLLVAGAGLHAGSALGALISFFPPVLPHRVGRLRVDPARDVYFRREAISLFYVPPAASQTTTRSQIASRSGRVMIDPACTRNGGLCGFRAGDTALVFDETGAADTFRITKVASSVLQLEHQGQMLAKVYTQGSYIAQVDTQTYYFDSRRDQLRRYDGWETDLPLVDDVVDVSFRYFGDPRPSRSPKLPIGTESCLFDTSGDPRLEPRAGSASLVELTEAMVTDGPWCGVPGNRFDAELYRIRRVRAFLQVQAPARSLRGGNTTLFKRPRPAGAGSRSVPDYAVSFDVTPRNMNLMR